MRVTLLLSCFAGLLFLLLGCNKSSTSVPTATASEVSTSISSGSINGGDTTVAYRDAQPIYHRSWLEWIPSAFADNTWTCTAPTITDNGTTVTTYSTVGDTYEFTGPSCSVTYNDGRTANSSWSGSWTLAYNTSCSVTGSVQDFKIGKQPNGCVLTRTASPGVTRSITGPLGNTYAITHDTDGKGTGYNTNVATSNAGVQFQCTGGTGPCTSGTITINGSHLTGTYNGASFWDHTVSTGTALSISVSGSTKTISAGTVVVQHNLLKTTSTSTFTNVVYSKGGCCFPVSGTISTTYSGGTYDGKTESLTFDGASCGIGTVTKTDGSTATLTMKHCI